MNRLFLTSIVTDFAPELIALITLSLANAPAPIIVTCLSVKSISFVSLESQYAIFPKNLSSPLYVISDCLPRDPVRIQTL